MYVQKPSFKTKIEELKQNVCTTTTYNNVLHFFVSFEVINNYILLDIKISLAVLDLKILGKFFCKETSKIYVFCGCEYQSSIIKFENCHF